MTEILSWLKDYSPGVVLLFALGAATLYVLRITVEKSLSAKLNSYAKEMELILQRRSAFTEKVLADRFNLIADFSARLEELMVTLNRIKHNRPAPEGFWDQNEPVPLTEIYKDLNIQRFMLNEEFYELFLKKANLALRAANALKNDTEWNKVTSEWISLNKQIQEVVRSSFRLDEVQM